MVKVYSLKSCDTCRKALKWLKDQEIDHDNHDIRSDGLAENLISTIVSAVGWEVALNRRSTTWRGLDDVDKENLDDSKAIKLILHHPTLMKRPAFITNSGVCVGFDEKTRNLLL